MRRVILVGLLCVACTRDNPAFDTRPLADEGTSEQDDGDGDGDTNGDGDGDASTTANNSDLPEPPACEFQPSEGLSLQVGGPDNFGGMCDIAGVDMSGQVVSVIGSELVVQTCTPGCLQCYDLMIPISTYPLGLEGHIPMTPGKCLGIEAHGPVAEEPDACYFGAMTIYEPDPITPYLIATAHSHEPTPIGMMLLGDEVPPPVLAGNCNCEDIGQGNDCCYMAPTPPEFWAYPFEVGTVFPGESVLLSVPNSLGIQHKFKLLQAQVLHSCESHDLQLSWALVAEL